VAETVDLVVDRRVLLDVEVLRKYSTRFSGKNSRNSLQSWAARVLLWAITSAGRCTRSITPAIVKVFPVPVAPSRVRKRSSDASPSASPGIAFGWSAVGV